MSNEERPEIDQADTEETTRPRRDSPSDEATIPPGPSQGDECTLPPGNADVDTTIAPRSEIGTAAVGDRIRYFGDYELLEEIARGGMGVVYKARQINLNRIVALKMILAGQFAGEEDVQRFYTEAEAAAQLDHPGIVPIFEIGQHQGQHYFSMAFIDGESMAQRVAEGPLPPREAAELAKRTTEAIAYAHSRGVIHRDLKPANVLLSNNDEPKVTDFGLAKKVEGDSNLTASGQILGTPAYMPPEQAAGKVDEVTDSADVYSLGAILYVLLTGRPPFQADNHLDTLLQVLEKEPLAPSQLVPGIPRDLETICMKCLQKEPHRRYVAAEALSHDLQRYLNGEPILARPISRVERTWRWCQRKPGTAGLIATAVLLLLTLGIGGPYIAVQQAEFAQRQVEFAERQVELRQVADEARLDAEARRREADEAKSVALAAQKHEAEQRQKAEQATREAELAQASESEARELAEAERDAKGIALNRAEGLALCAQSNAVRETHPSLALLLAIESVQRTPTRVTFANLYAAREASREVLTLVDHKGDVQDAAYSYDGRLIATASADGGSRSLRVWDAATGKMIRSWDHLQPWVSSVALSADGKRVAATTRGAVHFKVKSQSKVADLFQRLIGGSSDDGDKRLVYTDRICRIWDTSSGTELFRLMDHKDRVTSLVFTTDGKHIVTSSWDQTVRLWDADNGNELKVWKDAFDGRLLANVSCSNDGQFIVAIPENYHGRSEHPIDVLKDPDLIDPDASIVDGSIIANYFHFTNLPVPDVERPAVAFLINVEQDSVDALRISDTELRPKGCCLSPDGKQIAVAFEQGFAEVWDRADLDKPTIRLNGHHGPVNAVAFSEDGKFVATGGNDRTVRIWDVTTGEQKASLRGHSSPVHSVDFGPGDRLVSSSDETARVWDLQPVEPLARQMDGHKASVVSVQFDPSGNRLATASEDGTVRVWNTRSAEALFVFDDPGKKSKPIVARYSPDGKQLLAAYHLRNPIRIIDAETGEELRRLKDDRGVLDAFFTADGEHLVTVSDEHLRRVIETKKDGATHVRENDHMDYVKHPGHISIWDPNKGVQELTISDPAPAKFVPDVSPDGRWTVATKRHPWITAAIYDMDSGRQIHSLEGHRGRIRDIAISPQGDLILTGSEDDTACLWNSDTGARMARLEAFGGDVTLCAWNSDGSRFVTVAQSTAFVWDAKTFELIATLKGHESPITKAKFTPDGSHLFTLSEDRTAAFWKIESSRMMLLFQAAIDDEVVDADINSAGTLVATGSSDGSVRLWPVDVWPSINERLPRELTSEERRRYDLVTWQERLIEQYQSIPRARQERSEPSANESE